MSEENKGNKALTTKNGDKASWSEEFTRLLDNLNYEAKARAGVEEKSLEITDKDNERNFQLEKERMQHQATFYGTKQQNDYKTQKMLAFGGLLFFSALVYFSYKGNMTVIKDVFYPLLVAIISALGGYGYGMHKSRKQDISPAIILSFIS